MKPIKTVLDLRRSPGPALTVLAAASLLSVTVPAAAQIACPETNGTKFILLPQTDGGWDVKDDHFVMLADDFFCNTSGPITDIHLWGSWLTNGVKTNFTFTLAIYDDVPVSISNTFSHPGDLQWQETFLPGQYFQSFWSSSDELFLDPGQPQILGPDTQAWYFCFYPTNIFVQKGGAAAPKTYWLMVFAQPPAGELVDYGWKTTTNVQHDVSVFAPWPGFPPPAFHRPCPRR